METGVNTIWHIKIKNPRSQAWPFRSFFAGKQVYRSLMEVSRSPKIMSSISTPVKGLIIFAITSFLYQVICIIAQRG